MNKKELIEFEREIADLWEAGKIKTPVHLSGGNEDELIEIFKDIKEDDYVFSTHRSHFHALLKGMEPEELKNKILFGESMSIIDTKLKFYSSSIVAGTPAIAVGVALGIKRRGLKNKVWCFVGDGAVDEGHFYEALRYAHGFDLPIFFIVEDNDRSVETSKFDRKGIPMKLESGKLKWYNYKCTFPHVGTRKFVTFM